MGGNSDGGEDDRHGEQITAMKMLKAIGSYGEAGEGHGEMWGQMEAMGSAGRQMEPVVLNTGPVPAQESSSQRLRHLEALLGFVGAATAELLWLSQREDEEVTFDWSDRGPVLPAKQEAYSVRDVHGR